MSGKQRALGAEDLLEIKLLEDPEISPDARSVLYVVKEMIREESAYRRNIWQMDVRSGHALPLTEGNHQNGRPRWSPDGAKIAFLSTRSGSGQLWVMSADGSNPKQLTHASRDTEIGRPVWSPDGQMLAFTARVRRGGLRPLTPGRRSDRERFTEDVHVIDRIWWKENGEGILQGTRVHVFVVAASLGEPRQLTWGDYDHYDPAWSPDGGWIACSSHRAPGADYRLRTSNLWLIPSRGGLPQQLTDLPGPAAEPAWSPDGRLIAYVGHLDEYVDYSEPRLWVLPVDPEKGRPTGKPVLLTAELDRPIGDVSIDDLRGEAARSTPLVWSGGGAAIICAAGDRGATRLFRVPVAGGEIEALTPPGEVIYAYSFTKDGSVAAMAVTTPVLPNDLYDGRLEGTGPLERRRLTDLNRHLLELVTLSCPAEMIAASPDGTEVHGWVLMPPEHKRRTSQPAVLEIHGGPMVMYGYNFFFEFQLLAAHGFAVIYTNPRGSQGYGEAFCAALRGRWGGPDYADLISALDHAVAQHGLDVNRLGVAGGSYGGYMTNWAVTQTNRFRAAVSMRAISNRYSEYGTSDSGYLRRDDLGVAPWEDARPYLDSSPITYVTQVQTPLLMIHSMGDLRVPPEQAEQFFVALKQLAREVKLVLYPAKENHDLSRTGRPWHRVDRLDRILEWFQVQLL